ncbi:MAG: VWA domain-containing protein, partial [Methyloceanibacter sp.]|nr:VWA domain-containing protein [Methyloceanibacter sp.]
MQKRASWLVFFIRLAAMALGGFAVCGVPPARAEDAKPNPCNEDAMLVFDASGSMSGPVLPGNGGTANRIDQARLAVGKVLPSVTKYRRVGLITYGPGPYNQCNVELNLKPTPNAARIIMDVVNAIVPAGHTPLTAAVRNAAEVLDYRHKPGLIVVLTDGEETCGGSPCDLGKELHAAAAQLTIHIIGYRMKGLSWTGEGSILDAKCLAETNGGLYIATESKQDLIEALEKTLGCPMLSEL